MNNKQIELLIKVKDVLQESDGKDPMLALCNLVSLIENETAIKDAEIEKLKEKLDNSRKEFFRELELRQQMYMTLSEGHRGLIKHKDALEEKLMKLRKENQQFKFIISKM